MNGTKNLKKSQKKTTMIKIDMDMLIEEYKID